VWRRDRTDPPALEEAGHAGGAMAWAVLILAFALAVAVLLVVLLILMFFDVPAFIGSDD
jgi:hypothetical protein